MKQTKNTVKIENFLKNYLTMAQHEFLQADRKFYIDGSDHVLDFEIFEFCRPAKLLNHSSVFSSSQS